MKKMCRHIRRARYHLCLIIYSFSTGPPSEVSSLVNFLCKFSSANYRGKGKLLKHSAPRFSLV